MGQLQPFLIVLCKSKLKPEYNETRNKNHYTVITDRIYISLMTIKINTVQNYKHYSNKRI